MTKKIGIVGSDSMENYTLLICTCDVLFEGKEIEVVYRDTNKGLDKLAERYASYAGRQCTMVENSPAVYKQMAEYVDGFVVFVPNRNQFEIQEMMEQIKSVGKPCKIITFMK
jgi:hypothetical protein